MPIDPSIPLQVQPNRLGEIFAQFQQQSRSNRLADQQNTRQNRLIQLKEEQAENLDIEKSRKSSLKSTATFLETTAIPMLKDENIQGVDDAITKQIEANAGDPVLVDGLEKMQQALRQNPTGFARTADQTVSQARFEKLIPYPGGIDPNKKTGRGAFFTPRDVTIDDETVPFTFNNRTGEWERADIEGATSPKFDPSVQRSIAKSKAGGKVEGKERTTAKIDLPKVRSDRKYLTSLVKKAVKHPGMSGVVGAPGIGKAKQFIGGTKEANFKALYDQIAGKQFSQAYETLKGGGQITEIEGEKATNALSRMRTSVSEAEFRLAADEFISEINRLTALAEQRASGEDPNRALFDAADKIIGP